MTTFARKVLAATNINMITIESTNFLLAAEATLDRVRLFWQARRKVPRKAVPLVLPYFHSYKPYDRQRSHRPCVYFKHGNIPYY